MTGAPTITVTENRFVGIPTVAIAVPRKAKMPIKQLLDQVALLLRVMWGSRHIDEIMHPNFLDVKTLVLSPNAPNC